jgi:hypothetical protein
VQMMMPMSAYSRPVRNRLMKEVGQASRSDQCVPAWQVCRRHEREEPCCTSTFRRKSNYIVWPWLTGFDDDLVRSCSRLYTEYSKSRSRSLARNLSSAIKSFENVVILSIAMSRERSSTSFQSIKIVSKICMLLTIGKTAPRKS